MVMGVGIFVRLGGVCCNFVIVKLIGFKIGMKVFFLKGVIFKFFIWFKCNLCYCEGVLVT